MTREEKQNQMVLLTKMLVTEILLAVTGEDIYSLAKDAQPESWWPSRHLGGPESCEGDGKGGHGVT